MARYPAPFTVPEAVFWALPWQEQNEHLEPHIRAILRALIRPAPTTQIAYQLAERTHLNEARLGTVLIRRFAPHRGWAEQASESTNAFGKKIRRWTWNPLPKDDVSDLV